MSLLQGPLVAGLAGGVLGQGLAGDQDPSLLVGGVQPHGESVAQVSTALTIPQASRAIHRVVVLGEVEEQLLLEVPGPVRGEHIAGSSFG